MAGICRDVLRRKTRTSDCSTSWESCGSGGGGLCLETGLAYQITMLSVCLSAVQFQLLNKQSNFYKVVWTQHIWAYIITVLFTS
jgi:hypothetical protein